MYPEGIWRCFSNLSHSLFSHWGRGPDSRHHSRWVRLSLRSHSSQAMGTIMKKICIFVYLIKMTKKRAIEDRVCCWTTATNALYNDEQALCSKCPGILPLLRWFPQTFQGEMQDGAWVERIRKHPSLIW